MFIDPLLGCEGRFHPGRGKRRLRESGQQAHLDHIPDGLGILDHWNTFPPEEFSIWVR